MSSQERHLYEFAEFRLDTAERLLLHNGTPVPLSPKAFDTLVVLIQHSGHLIEKDQLMKEIWPDTFVEEVNLAVNISALRKALGQSESGEHFIDTVPKRGYRFVATVRELECDDTDLVVHHRIRARIVSEEIEQEAKELDVSPTLTNGRLLPPQVRSYKARAALFVTVILIFVGLLFGLYKWLGQKSGVTRASTFGMMRLAPLTSTGRAIDAAISPDGKYVAYVSADSGKQSLRMKQVAAVSDVQIIPPADAQYNGVEFSSDGNYIYFLQDEGLAGVLYRVPTLGGMATKLIVNIDSLVTFSPDGKSIAFVRGYPSQGESALLIANVDGTAEQKLAVLKNPDRFSASDEAPAWSPDGKIIACSGDRLGPGNAYATVLGVRVEDGQVQPLTTQHWWRVGRMAWLPDGNGLVVNAKEENISPSQLWYLAYPGGEQRRITNDLTDYRGVSMSDAGAALVTVKRDLLSSIWIANDRPSTAQKIPSNGFDGFEGISWTPDGKVVYASRVSGNSDIWLMDPDGSNKRQLTANSGNNRWPSASANGRYIVFMSDRTGSSCIWRMDRDGRNLKQLTTGGGERFPDCCSDSEWIVYLSVLGKQRLFKVPIDGGEPVPISEQALARPTISPDGKWIAAAYFEENSSGTAIYPFAGGNASKILDFWDFNLRWTPDGRALAHVDPRGTNLITQPIDGSASHQITDFDSDQIFLFAWSRDGKHLALTRGNITSDVVLIRNFR